MTTEVRGGAAQTTPDFQDIIIFKCKCECKCKDFFLITRKIVEEEKKLEKWRIWQYKLDSLVDRLSLRLERVKEGGKPKDRKSLHEKKDEAQVIM